MAAEHPPSSQLVRILAVAGVELRAVFRSHPFRLFLPVGILFVLVAPRLVLFAFDARDQMTAQLGVSTAALFALLLGLASGAGSVSADRDSGRQALVLSGPLPPGGWLFGKWIALSAAVLVAVATIGAVHLLALFARGGPPAGYGLLVLALLAAAAGGALAGALALAFSTRLKPAPAFLAALLAWLSGHAVVLAGPSPLADALRYLLPGTAGLGLSSEAAFGTLPFAVAVFALAHALVYSLFVLTVGSCLLDRGTTGGPS